jgi:hypothetical protein
MLSTYCQHCGAKNEYRFTKPNFCSSCGNSLDGSEKKDTVKKNKKGPCKSEAEEIPEEIFDADGTDVYEVPHIENFAYEIEVGKNSFSLGDLFKNIEGEVDVSSTSDPPSPRKRGRPRKK